MIAYEVKVNVPLLNVREKANADANVVRVAQEGETLKIIEVNKEWGRLADKSGWVMLSFCTHIEKEKAEGEEENERVIENVEQDL